MTGQDRPIYSESITYANRRPDHISPGSLCLPIAKTGLTETILDENRESPLTAPAFQQLPLIFAPVTSPYDLVVGTFRP